MSTQLDRAIERYEAGHVFMSKNIDAIVNALLFIDQHRGRSTWSKDAPPDLLQKALSGGTGSHKAEKKLIALGWTKVRLCELENTSSNEHGSGHRPVRSHWRRGHWRRQRHGPANSLVKLVRIRPIMVGQGEVAEGRLYSSDLPKQGADDA